MFCGASERVGEGRKEQRTERRTTGPVSAPRTGQGAGRPLTGVTSKVRLHEKKNASPNLRGGPQEREYQHR